MNYLYGRKWHVELRKPIAPITQEEARDRFESGPSFTVSAGQDLEPGRVPEYTLTVGPQGEFLDTLRYDRAGSVLTAYAFTPQEGVADQLFLMEVTTYLYPPEEVLYRYSDAVAVSTFTFRPDGWARRRLAVTAAPEAQVEEFTGVDVSSHWVPAVTFGDWDRFGRAREPGPV